MMKVLSRFRPIILSRHPSHSVLRAKDKALPLFNHRTIIRFGSTTATSDYEKGKKPIAVEINTVNAVKNSSSKLLMKQCFTNGNVKTADWVKGSEVTNDWLNERFPVVAKSNYGSRGNGNTLINNIEEYNNWASGKNLNNYIIERFYNFVREYRLHVTKHGCFYTCRKMLKSDTPDDQKWFRNDKNSVWILEENEAFDKPINWKEIEDHCVKALTSVGLDVGACDVKVQSSKHPNGDKREYCDFIIIEINSAPSFGEVTAKKYIEVLPKLITEKYNA